MYAIVNNATRLPIRNCARSAATVIVMQRQSWWWRRRGNLAAYEKTGKYQGVYHVLHGAISPMLGIGPGDIKLKELMERLQGDVDEVIIATNSSLERGDDGDVYQQIDQAYRYQSE